MTERIFQSAAALARAIAAGELSSREIVEACLARIERRPIAAGHGRHQTVDLGPGGGHGGEKGAAAQGGVPPNPPPALDPRRMGLAICMGRPINERAVAEKVTLDHLAGLKRRAVECNTCQIEIPC